MLDLTEAVENLQASLNRLQTMLKSDTAIDEQRYCEEVGLYSKELNLLLRKYFEVNEEDRDVLRPWVNYFRQLQHYLVFLVMNAKILEVPQHGEIIQTLNFMKNQKVLIQNVYVGFSEAQKQLFSKENLKKLDEFLEEKLKRMGRYSTKD